MAETGEKKAAAKGTEVERLTNGAILVSNENEILIAIDKTEAKELLSEEAIKLAHTKGWFLCFPGALTTIPLYELSRNNAEIRDLIVSEESLRATLCGNFPEYVKTHNMNNPIENHIKDADAPLNLFLQKHLDNAAGKTRSEIAEFQHSRTRESAADNMMYNDVLELER